LANRKVAPFIERRLQQFLENSHPVSKENLLDLLVGEPAFD
jgi:hypothetical protein